MRPHKRAKLSISQTFLDIEAQDSGQDDSEDGQSDEDIQSFLIEDGMDEIERVITIAHALAVQTADVVEEELDILADRARQRHGRQRSHPRGDDDSFTRELAVAHAGYGLLGGRDVLGSDAPVTRSMKLFFVRTKVSRNLLRHLTWESPGFSGVYGSHWQIPLNMRPNVHMHRYLHYVSLMKQFRPCVLLDIKRTDSGSSAEASNLL